MSKHLIELSDSENEFWQISINVLGKVKQIEEIFKEKQYGNFGIDNNIKSILHDCNNISNVIASDLGYMFRKKIEEKIR